MSAFVARPPIERRHARQRIAKKPSRQVARLKLGAAIAICQRQRTRPNARREREVSALADASDVIHDFGHCSFPRTTSPMPQPYGTPAPWPNRDDGLSELRCLRPEVRQGREQRSNRETLPPTPAGGAKPYPCVLMVSRARTMSPVALRSKSRTAGTTQPGLTQNARAAPTSKC